MKTHTTLDTQSTPCKYCQADRPFALKIPGLKGNQCQCGIWIAECPGCLQWRSELLEVGICSQCWMAKQSARESAKLETDRRKRKAQTVTALKTAVAGGSSNV